MKRLAGLAIIFAGAITLAFGLLATSFVQDSLPINFPSSGSSHSYFRVVPAEPQPPSYVAPSLIVVGIFAVAIGIFIRRKNAV